MQFILPPPAALAHHSFTPYSTAAAHNGVGCREMHGDAATPLLGTRPGSTWGSAHTEHSLNLPPLPSLLRSVLGLNRCLICFQSISDSIALFQPCRFYSGAILFFIFFFWADFSTQYLQCLSCTPWLLLVQCSLKDSQHRVK